MRKKLSKNMIDFEKDMEVLKYLYNSGKIA